MVSEQNRAEFLQIISGMKLVALSVRDQNDLVSSKEKMYGFCNRLNELNITVDDWKEIVKMLRDLQEFYWGEKSTLRVIGSAINYISHNRKK